MSEHFFLNPEWDPQKNYQPCSELTLGVMANKEYSPFPKAHFTEASPSNAVCYDTDLRRSK